MQIHVVLSPESAAALRGRSPSTPVVEALLDEARALGVALTPTHPGRAEPTLEPFYQVEVTDPGAVEHVLARLRAAEAVDAAYVKPPDALP